MAPEPALTVAYLNWATLMQYPVIACEVLIFFEALRVLPGELRMIVRMCKRGKPNVAEILFFLTKYMAVLGFISDALTQLTSYWINAKGCLAFSWIYQLCLYSCTTTISATLAWRCYVIFQRRYRVGAYLLIGLAVQFALAMATCQAQLKFSEVEDGYCKIPDDDIEAVADKPVWKKFGPWFLFFMVVFDGTLVVCTSWRLIKCVRGPSGLQRIGKLLFVNNLHYLAIVCGLNATEAILYIWFASILPNLLPLTIVIEIMIGLQLLISEQDAAHGYGKSHVQMGAHSNAPSSFTRPSATNTAASQWTESKRRLNTSSSTHQLGTMTSTSGGIDGFRYDCTEEVLVDYDMTLTRLAPGDDVEPWVDGHPLTSAAEFSSHSAGGSRIDAGQGHSSGQSASPSYHPNTPGSPHSPSTDGDVSNGNGYSIRAIRANMHSRSPPNSSGGRVQRTPTLGSNNPYADNYSSSSHHVPPSPYGDVSGNYELRVNPGGNQAAGGSPPRTAKRSGSLASFGSAATGISGQRSVATGTTTSYGAALTRTTSNAGSRAQHILTHPNVGGDTLDDNSFETMLPRNHDAPFSGYGHVSPAPEPASQHGQGQGQGRPSLARRDTGRSSLAGGGSAY